MIDKVIIDNKDIKLTENLFKINPADMTQHEIISRPRSIKKQLNKTKAVN